MHPFIRHVAPVRLQWETFSKVAEKKVNRRAGTNYITVQRFTTAESFAPQINISPNLRWLVF